jgi:hypothetical protein
MRQYKDILQMAVKSNSSRHIATSLEPTNIFKLDHKILKKEFSALAEKSMEVKVSYFSLQITLIKLGWVLCNSKIKYSVGDHLWIS